MLSDFFENVVNRLGINRDEVKFYDGSVLSKNPVETTIKKFRNHHRVKLIRDNIRLSDIYFSSGHLKKRNKAIILQKMVLLKVFQLFV